MVLVAQVGSQAGKFSTCFRPCWEYLPSFSVLSSVKRVFSFAVHWPNFRGKYQVSYLARTHCNGPLHSTWTLLYDFLGQDSSNLGRKLQSTCPKSLSFFFTRPFCIHKLLGHLQSSEAPFCHDITIQKLSLQMLMWNKVGISNVAGGVALLAGLTMWATTLPFTRRKVFELFFYSHHLYIVFVVFFVLHVGFSSSCVILAGFYLFLIDRYLRFLQSQQRIRLVSARVLPCEAVELNFSKNPGEDSEWKNLRGSLNEFGSILGNKVFFSHFATTGLCYAPTSIIFINVPSISKLQWHPFSITSCCHTDPDTLSIVIRSSGSWSHTLYQKLSSSSPMAHLDVSIEGPYGPDSTFFSGYWRLTKGAFVLSWISFLGIYVLFILN